MYVENCNIRDLSDTATCMVGHPDRATRNGIMAYTNETRGALKALLPACKQPTLQELAANSVGESTPSCHSTPPAEQIAAALHAAAAGLIVIPVETAAAFIPAASAAEVENLMPREMDPGNARRRLEQQTDRRAPAYLATHRQVSRIFHPRQTRRRNPHRSRHARAPQRIVKSMSYFFSGAS